jgi:hypothetical protein
MVLSIILLITVSASTIQAEAQTLLQSPPGIVIRRWSWSESSNASSAVPRTNSTAQRPRDPFKTKDPLDEARQVETITVQPPPRNRRPIKGYQYRVTIKNTGTKTIQGMSWDYIFIDPAAEDRVTHHQFQSKKKIRPGREAQITEFSLAPPSRVVSARVVNKPKDQPFVEQVIITRIEYIDGSVWVKN